MADLFRADVVAIDTDTTFGRLLDGIKQRLFETGYFREVRTYVREPEGVTTPAAVVWPRSPGKIEGGVSNIGAEREYTFDVGLMVRTADEDAAVKLQAAFQEVVLDTFDKRPPVVFEEVAGHWDTNVREKDAMPAPGLVGDELWIVGSGLEVVCSVNE